MNIIDSKDFVDFYLRLNLIDNRFLKFLECNLDKFENEITGKDLLKQLVF